MQLSIKENKNACNPFDPDGNPNKRNGLRQTSLHSVCQVIGQQKSPTALERRSYSVMLLLR